MPPCTACVIAPFFHHISCQGRQTQQLKEVRISAALKGALLLLAELASQDEKAFVEVLQLDRVPSQLASRRSYPETLKEAGGRLASQRQRMSRSGSARRVKQLLPVWRRICMDADG